MVAVRVTLAIGVALALQTTLARFLVHGSIGVDLVLVAVGYLGLTGGPVVGIISGTIAGLAQDTLASGVVGMNGLAKTVVGFLAGLVGTAFIVTQPVPRFMVFFGATVLEMLIIYGLHALLDPVPGAVPWAAIAAQALGNALVGVVVFQVSEAVPGMMERRRAMGRTRGRR
jgi:rod shape-determining protein MreD